MMMMMMMTTTMTPVAVGLSLSSPTCFSTLFMAFPQSDDLNHGVAVLV